jgi:hypothetical protein
MYEFLDSLLEESPHLVFHSRYLGLTIYPVMKPHVLHILLAYAQSPQLITVSIALANVLWSNIGEELMTKLLSLFQTHTTRSLFFSGASHVPLSLFANSRHLSLIDSSIVDKNAPPYNDLHLKTLKVDSRWSFNLKVLSPYPLHSLTHLMLEWVQPEGDAYRHLEHFLIAAVNLELLTVEFRGMPLILLHLFYIMTVVS